jgi:hypothetical protein
VTSFLSPDEAYHSDPGYAVQDGVVINRDDDTPKPTSRRYQTSIRTYEQTKIERRAEEAAWAARSGPVYIKQKGNTP